MYLKCIAYTKHILYCTWYVMKYKKTRFHVNGFEYDFICFHDYWTYANDWPGLQLGT